MKYEPVFGDQLAFDGAPSDSTHTTKGGGFYRVTEDGGVQYLSRGPLNGDMCKCIDGYLIAERRIIAEPKRWTLEDKKAGRLPEVGCAVDTFIGECVVIGADLNLKFFSVQYQDDGCMDILHISKIKPIETPEEKAARIRKEWCNKAIELAHIHGSSAAEAGAIYDAILSGDLSTPVQAKDGE